MSDELFEAFSRWSQLVDELHDECAPELQLASVADGDLSRGLHVARDRAQLTEAVGLDAEALDEVHKVLIATYQGTTAASTISRLRDVLRRYVKLELRFGGEARDLLRKRVEETFRGAVTLREWGRNRLRAITLLRIFRSGCLPPDIDRDEVLLDILSAYQIGILAYAFPQWVPFFEADEMLHRALVPMLLHEPKETFDRASNNGLRVARELNWFFHEYACAGEWLCFGFLMSHYVGKHCDNAVYELVSKRVEEHRRELEGDLEARFLGYVSSIGDSQAALALLGSGAPKYCEKMVRVEYGRFDTGAMAMDGEVLGDLLPMLPVDHIDSGIDWYLQHSAGGLLGGVMGCSLLLRALNYLEALGGAPFAQIYSSAASSFLVALKQRLSELPSSPLGFAAPVIMGIARATLDSIGARAEV